MDFRLAKQLLDSMLRRLRLRVPVDTVLFCLSALRTYRMNRAFKRSHPGYSVPPLRLMYDAFDHTMYHEYLETGRAHARDVADILKRHLPDLLARQPARICEWGCGPGKIIRNLAPFLPGVKVELYGTDYNADTIAWCKRSIPGIVFFKNSLAPPLAFHDAFFDIVIARSVFTHLSRAMNLAWIDELLRIVREGGAVVFTTNGESSVHMLLPKELARFRAGEMVSKECVQEGKKYYGAIHPPAFVRNHMVPGRDIAAYLPSEKAGTIGQDVWVVRK
jgi:SAM-dependent methyltransferase